MADISRYLNAILSAVYGEEVRGSIHDAIDIINREVISSTSSSDAAVATANAAKANAETALEYARLSRDYSDSALQHATSSDANAAIALANSQQAVNTSDIALNTANNALNNSIEALRTANAASDLSQATHDIVVYLKQIIETQGTYVTWLYNYMQIVDESTASLAFTTTIQDSDGNDILDSDGEVIGEEAEGFAAFVRYTLDHIERTGNHS